MNVSNFGSEIPSHTTENTFPQTKGSYIQWGAGRSVLRRQNVKRLLAGKAELG